MAGEKLADLDVPVRSQGYYAVKESVFPFDRFAGADTLLGPEMRSTGEVMGVGTDFISAFARASRAAGVKLGGKEGALLTVKEGDKEDAVAAAKILHDAGWKLFATRGTCAAINAAGVACERVFRVGSGSPDCVELIESGEVSLVVNTPEYGPDIADSAVIRRAALYARMAYCTTTAGALATARAIGMGEQAYVPVTPMQEHYRSGRMRAT